jgi:hypothetical protein
MGVRGSISTQAGADAMTRSDLLPEAQASSSTATILLMGIVLVALAVVIGAMEAGAAALMMLLREMFTVMLAQLGRLMFIGLCLLCLVIVLVAQLKGGGAGSH